MKHRLLNIAAVTLSASAVALTQAPAAFAQGADPNPNCVVGATQDACQKTLDLFQYMAPQLGTIIAGGNATLGQGGTLGGFPHFRVSIRANVMNGSLPDVAAITPSTSGAQQDTYQVDKQIIGLPQVDAAVGVFKGFPLGFTNVGGVDLLVSFSYLPSFDGDDIKVNSSGAQFGAGVRIGLLQETLTIPGLSFTYLRRDLPTIDIRTAIDDDSLLVDDIKIKTGAWRLVASKNLMIFGLAAGIGKDNYNSSAAPSVFVAARPGGPATDERAGPLPAKQKVNRTNMFFDLSMNLPVVKIVAEVGRVSGGKIETYNIYEGTAANASRVYGSLGFRFGF
jgi:hypothetical protein